MPSKKMPAGNAKPLGTKRGKAKVVEVSQPVPCPRCGEATVLQANSDNRKCSQCYWVEGSSPEPISQPHIDVAHEDVHHVDTVHVAVEEKTSIPEANVVDSIQSDNPTLTQKDRTVKFILKTGEQKGKSAVFQIEGLRYTAKIPKAAFKDGVAPASFDKDTFDDIFAAPKAKLTPAERKALPKPTLAEKIAKREAALAKLKAKDAAEQAKLAAATA